MPVTSLMSTTHHQESLTAKLPDLLNRVNSSPVTTRQKIKLYKDDICPRLTWGFRVMDQTPHLLGWARAGTQSHQVPQKVDADPSGWQPSTYCFIFPKKMVDWPYLPYQPYISSSKPQDTSFFKLYKMTVFTSIKWTHEDIQEENSVQHLLSVMCTQTTQLARGQPLRPRCHSRFLKILPSVEHNSPDLGYIQRQLFHTDSDLSYWVEAVSSLSDQE
jgi:hypothetical protein